MRTKPVYVLQQGWIVANVYARHVIDSGRSGNVSSEMMEK
jgi:hypothetical protein